MKEPHIKDQRTLKEQGPEAGVLAVVPTPNRNETIVSLRRKIFEIPKQPRAHLHGIDHGGRQS